MLRALAFAFLTPIICATAAPADPVPITSYPWKTDILTTVFWMDSPDPPDTDPSDLVFRRSPGTWRPPLTVSPDEPDHPARTNPFYVALPFNDLAYPDLARKWMPPSWSKVQKGDYSVCRDRWVEIKGPTGRVCFAQWEDVGPLFSDEAAYVFGPEQPPRNAAGLDVSPAVAKYLGISNQAHLSWRFVDVADVKPGRWLLDTYQGPLMLQITKSNPPVSTPGEH